MKLVPLRSCHLLDFFQNIRPADRRELEASTGESLDDMTLESFEDGVALIHKDRLLGVGGINVTHKVIWFLATTAIECYPLTFLRFSRKKLQEFLNEHGQLRNAVHIDNTLHISWLTWLGAEFGPMVAPGFRYFEFKRKDDV